MNMPKAVLLSLSLLFLSTSQSTENTPFNSVQDFFAALSEFDYARMKTVVTDDFQILEAGEVWDIETLIKLTKPHENNVVRRNFFSLIKVDSREEIAWLSYWNKANFKTSDEIIEMAWLEGVFLVKDNGAWRMQLMHSTVVSLENVPMNITFEEYKD